VDYRVLGPFEVRSGGRSVALGSPKQRAFLAILLLHARELVPTDALIEALWGDHPPRTAAHSIQVYVSELRKALQQSVDGPRIVTRPPGYMLDADPDAIDARRFERLLEDAAHTLGAGDAGAAADRISEALALWHGRPLADFAYDEFAQAEITRLERLRADALEALAAAELSRGRGPAALAAAESAIAEDPLRERARELQMLALCRVGRHADALRAYATFEAVLSEELGLEPGPSLRGLQERVILHDPALGAAVVGEAALEVPLPRNPYKGLRPFREDDADEFFGRESLVSEVLASLAGGARLIALVGPSGSGKSSIVHAGLLPALRRGALAGSERWRIARMTPGSQPLESVEVALGQAGVGESDGPVTPTEAVTEGPLQPATRLLPRDDRLVLVVDQFEELFIAGDARVRQRFLKDLTSAVTDPGGRVTAVLALRADFYDRPLLDPAFAPVFTRGTVTVVPMSAADLEAAIVRPAGQVGVEVEPALLAQLTADTLEQPGALPLLQYALTELFERRAGPALTLAAYQAMGGLREAVARRAEELHGSLSRQGRHAALQVFLRLVRLEDGTGPTRRRVPLRELTDLELDAVALSEVLDAFGRHRLLSFDRDPVTGDATVEVAHEALLREWRRLADWIDRHRVDLRRHAALVAATREWQSSDHDPDYLFIGSRLAEYEAWTADSGLRLTAAERGFLEAGIARRDAELANETARREGQRRLERRARTRLWGLLAAIAVLAAAGTFGILNWLGSGPPDVALLFQGTGDAGSFGDMAAAGFGRAASDFGLRAETRLVSLGRNEVEPELRGLADRGVGLVVVGLGYDGSEATIAVAADHPDTRFVAWETDGPVPDNVTNIDFRSEEGAYLAGVAAASHNRTGIIGFIGMWQVPIIEAYRAGFEAGARSVTPGIEVRSAYLAQFPDSETPLSPPVGREVADQLYESGVDVILAVVPTPNWGVFEAATSESDVLHRKLWVIAVDTDAYLTTLDLRTKLPEGVDPARWQPHILTSVTKRLDNAIYKVLEDYTRGSLAPGPRTFGLADKGVGVSTSGGFLDDLQPRLDVLERLISSGVIVVPTEPTESATPAP